MASQLEQIDLHQDSKQAINVYFEMNQKSTLNGDQRTKLINDAKDASTQTISSMNQQSLFCFYINFNVLFKLKFLAKKNHLELCRKNF